MLLFNQGEWERRSSEICISIHLMLLFNGTLLRTATSRRYFNTSNVTIQLSTILQKAGSESNFNTSNVTIQR